MNTTSASLRPVTLFALVAALTASACKSEIIGGGGVGGDGARGTTSEEGGSGGVGGTSGGGGGVTGSTGGVVTSLAEWFSMTNEFPMGAGPDIDPNTLFVKIGNYGPVCGGTFPYDCEPLVKFQLSIGLPPSMQVPGTYSLANPAIISTSAEGGQAPGEPGACFGSGGVSVEGSIEVVSNDGAVIVVRLQGTSADGEYAASICSWEL